MYPDFSGVEKAVVMGPEAPGAQETGLEGCDPVEEVCTETELEAVVCVVKDELVLTADETAEDEITEDVELEVETCMVCVEDA